MSDAETTARRVLVTDDVRSLALLVADTLRRRGYEVDIAGDGEECLAKVRSFRPALVILDIMMPKVHGLEALRRIRQDEETRGVGVIVCTSKDYKTDQDSARQLGASDVVIKPFRPEALADRVDAFFQGGGREGVASAAGGTTGAATSPAAAPQEVWVPKPATGLAWRFWGTRGSIPVSGPTYVRHGGNTPCLSLDPGEGPLIVIDAGSGIRELGETLIARGPREIHLFITHTHWDHIQGFPFFVPAYVPGYKLVLYAAAGFGKDLRSVFQGQLDREYFPAQLEDMRASIEFRTLSQSFVRVGPCVVSWEYTHHPSACVGYKVAYAGQSLAWISDNEFLKGYLGPPEPVLRNGDLLAPYEKIVGFARGADLLIHEAQYRNEEYKAKVGWGHSSVSNACVLACLARAPQWLVTHHDPRHTDEVLEEKLAVTRRVLQDLGHKGEVCHAFDGMAGVVSG